MKNQNLMPDFTKPLSEEYKSTEEYKNFMKKFVKQKEIKTLKTIYLDRITKEFISEFVCEHDELFDGEWEHGEKDLYVKTNTSYTTEEYFNSHK